MRTTPAALALVLVLAAAGAAPAQFADVIVSEIAAPWNWGSAGGIAAFSVATTACNVGDAAMTWHGSSNQHPVIATNLFRLKDNRFEHIGQAWVKHGFAAQAGTFCGACQNPGSSQILGVGCSDVYLNQQNGIQTSLAPKSEVNAATGAFPYPWTDPPSIPPTIGRRLQASHANLNPATNPGAQYFVEVQYVSPNDVAGARNHNNASYRRAFVSPMGSSYALAFAGTHPTQREKPAIQAWQDVNPEVTITTVDVPGDGRFLIAALATDNGNGTWHYEYAVHNLNSDRSLQAFTVALPAGGTPSGAGFTKAAYHSGEPGGYATAAWGVTTGAAGITWASATYATNPAANALRWGTLATFRFDCNTRPGNLTLTLFKPGTPASIVVPSPLPALAVSIMGGAPSQVAAGAPHAISAAVTSLDGSAVNSVTLWTSVEGAAFTPAAMTPLGGGAYGGTLPVLACFQTVRWYVSAAPAGPGAATTSPAGAPVHAYETEGIAPGLRLVLADDCESPTAGWTVTNAMGAGGDGAWDPAPAVPIGGGDRGDPPTAAGGSGRCFLTDNLDGDSDVDDGETRLDSPVIDLTGYADARISVRIWYDRDFTGGSDDVMLVRISNDGGATWVTMESWGRSTAAWEQRRYRVGRYVAPTSQVRVRFVASDYGGGHVIEAGVDDLVVEGEPTAPYLGTAAAGAVGATASGPFDVLFVNGSAGGPARRVDIGLGSPVTFSVAAPPTGPAVAAFAIFGLVGAATPDASHAILPGLGDFCFLPCPVAAGDPAAFMLADAFPIGACPPLLPASPAPWSFGIPSGVPVPIEVTLQGVIVDSTAPFGIATTNAILFRVF